MEVISFKKKNTFQYETYVRFFKNEMSVMMEFTLKDLTPLGPDYHHKFKLLCEWDELTGKELEEIGNCVFEYIRTKSIFKTKSLVENWELIKGGITYEYRE
jgi:hypothetical protein